MSGWKCLGLTLVCLGGILMPGFAEENKGPSGFQNRVFKDADGTESKYVLFLPKAIKAEGAPIILFLHGAGETGTEGERQAQVGIGPAIRKIEEKFPFIVVMPQSQKRTWQATSADGKRALAILDATIKEFKPDTKRVYLTGLSMGGYGTWSMAAAHPDRWAAIAPVCGGGNPADAEKFKSVPCWCFHGDADKAVPVQRSRDMIEALKKAGAQPRYTEYPGVGHNSWDQAYGTAELYDWLLTHKK